MKRFCGQCGSPINPRLGYCPKCDSQQTQSIWENAMEQDDYLFEDGYSSRNRTRRKKSNAPLIVILVLALTVLLGAAAAALFYFEVLNLPDLGQMWEDILPEREEEEDVLILTTGPDVPEDPVETASARPEAMLPAPTMETVPPTAVPTEPLMTFPEVEVGDILYIGRYDQDNNHGNGAEPIAWIVLEVYRDEALVISQKALASLQYHYFDEPVTWETCSLRTWLNEAFYEAAFTDEEKAVILTSLTTDHNNPRFPTDPGEDTRDQVFLLSLMEAEDYFISNADRICRPTALAKDQGAYVRSSTGGCWWWLRSPGNTPQDAASVNSDGSIDYDDGSVNSQKGCVRPAMWIQIG